MKVKFWGTRGSIPIPGPETMKYGGNTSCVSVECADNIFIFDAGTGIRLLGIDLLKNGEIKYKKISIFFSHLHWDHIQGFPFFKPLFIPGAIIDLYGFNHGGYTVESALNDQMANPSFPLMLKNLPSQISFQLLKPDQPIGIDGVRIENMELDHPGQAYGYKIKYNNKSLVYATDCEYSEEISGKMADFAWDSDVLIFDAQYTAEEYSGTDGGGGRKGWGHSTWNDAVNIARKSNSKKLVLFHHGRDDKRIDEVRKTAMELFENTIAAYEGLEIIV